MEVGTYTIVSKATIKYLGKIIDAKLRLREPRVCVPKAASATAEIAKILPNNGGPQHCQRLLLAGVVPSTLLYPSLVWSEAPVNKDESRGIRHIG